MKHIKKIANYLSEIRDDYFITPNGTVYRKVMDSDYIIQLYELRGRGISYENIPKYMNISQGWACSLMNKSPQIYKKLKGKYDKDGYLEYQLRKQDGGRVYKRGHRLVAHCYLLNNKNKPMVNHIDGVKDNNCVSNLEWVTNSENVLHAIDNLGLSPEDNLPNNKISISATYKNGLYKEFQSITDASKFTGVSLGYLYRKLNGNKKVICKGIEFNKPKK